MQLSGPWPPYHFVHRLTRPAHPQPAAAVHIATPVIRIPEPVPMLA
jgi:hypothetical protein